MRARDRHTTFVLAGMLLLNVLTAAGSVVAVWRLARRADLAAEKAEASEKASVQASAAALLLSDRVSESPRSSDEDPQRPLETVVGYGQTRTKAAIYLYRDVRDGDGIVRREFIQRFPITSGPKTTGGSR